MPDTATPPAAARARLWEFVEQCEAQVGPELTVPADGAQQLATDLRDLLALATTPGDRDRGRELAEAAWWLLNAPDTEIGTVDWHEARREWNEAQGGGQDVMKHMTALRALAAPAETEAGGRCANCDHTDADHGARDSDVPGPRACRRDGPDCDCWGYIAPASLPAQGEAGNLPRTTHEADEQVWAVHDELRRLGRMSKSCGPFGVLVGPSVLHGLADQLTSGRWRPVPVDGEGSAAELDTPLVVGQVVRNERELDDLPIGVVLRTNLQRRVAVRESSSALHRLWSVTGLEHGLAAPEDLALLPARILDLPGEQAPISSGGV